MCASERDVSRHLSRRIRGRRNRYVALTVIEVVVGGDFFALTVGRRMHAAFGETARKQLRVVEGIAPADDPVIARRQIEFCSLKPAQVGLHDRFIQHTLSAGPIENDKRHPDDHPGEHCRFLPIAGVAESKLRVVRGRAIAHILIDAPRGQCQRNQDTKGFR